MQCLSIVDLFVVLEIIAYGKARFRKTDRERNKDKDKTEEYILIPIVSHQEVIINFLTKMTHFCCFFIISLNILPQM